MCFRTDEMYENWFLRTDWSLRNKSQTLWVEKWKSNVDYLDYFEWKSRSMSEEREVKICEQRNGNEDPWVMKWKSRYVSGKMEVKICDWRNGSECVTEEMEVNVWSKKWESKNGSQDRDICVKKCKSRSVSEETEVQKWKRKFKNGKCVLVLEMFSN